VGSDPCHCILTIEQTWFAQRPLCLPDLCVSSTWQPNFLLLLLLLLLLLGLLQRLGLAAMPCLCVRSQGCHWAYSNASEAADAVATRCCQWM
jgi:hypothetical protein